MSVMAIGKVTKREGTALHHFRNRHALGKRHIAERPKHHHPRHDADAEVSTATQTMLLVISESWALKLP